jgi:hypothetical protein
VLGRNIGVRPDIALAPDKGKGNGQDTIREVTWK